MSHPSPIADVRRLQPRGDWRRHACGLTLLLLLTSAGRAQGVPTWTIPAQTDLYAEEIISNLGQTARVRTNTNFDPPARAAEWIGHTLSALWVTVEVAGQMSVGVEISGPPLLAPSRLPATLPKAGRYLIAPTLKWDIDRLYGVKAVQPVTLTFRLLAADGRELRRESRTVQLHAVEECAITLRDPIDGQLRPRRDALAGYVNESHPTIDRLLRGAFEKEYVKEFLGSQATSDEVEIAEVRAVWQTMEAAGMRYTGIGQAFVPRGGRQVRHIRLFADALTKPPADSVEGSLLFAGMFLHLGWEAELVFFPDRCFVAVHLRHAGRMILDPTQLGASGGFDPMVQQATALHAAAEADFNKGDGHFVVNLATARRNGVPTLRSERTATANQ